MAPYLCLSLWFDLSGNQSPDLSYTRGPRSTYSTAATIEKERQEEGVRAGKFRVLAVGFLCAVTLIENMGNMRGYHVVRHLAHEG